MSEFLLIPHLIPVNSGRLTLKVDNPHSQS